MALVEGLKPGSVAMLVIEEGAAASHGRWIYQGQRGAVLVGIRVIPMERTETEGLKVCF